MLESIRTPLPLGREAFRTQLVSPTAAGHVLAAIEKYRQTTREYDVTNLQVVATTAVREARNRDVLLDSVRRKTGLDVAVLTAGDVVYYFDAYLFFRMSRVLPIRQQTILTAELGAGTSDFSVMRRGAVLATVGLPLGMLRLTQLIGQAGAEPSAAGTALREYVTSELTGLRRQLPHIRLDGIVLFSEDLVPVLDTVLGIEKKERGLVRLRRRRAEELWNRCRGRSAAELAEVYKLPPDAAETLEALSATVSTLLDVFEQDGLHVVETSLGEALLTYRLFDLGGAERYDKLRQQLSVARSLVFRHGGDLKHSRQVAFLCRRLFAGLADHLGLEPGDLNYLMIAANLHDIGKSVSVSAHHKHSEYLINALNLFRLDAEEIRLIACVARYHRRSTPRDAHPLYMSLSPLSRIKVQKLAALLRVADALDRSHTAKVKDLRARVIDGTALEVRVRAVSEPVLGRLSFAQKKNLLSEISGCDVRLVVEQEAL